MKVLIDECAPRALKHYLAANGHDCLTVQEYGWSGKQNGELLSLAEGRYEVLVTVDTSLQYQQNLAGRRIAVVRILARSNRLDVLSLCFPACLEAHQAIKPGDIVRVGSSA
jgi:predicted nuclease of predicted toxin-antitoxin system